MIDSSRFAQMKQGALLINTARAKVIDQQAMVQALTQGKLAGAAVDVMWQEPCPANHPFLAMDNVIVSPHGGCHRGHRHVAVAAGLRGSGGLSQRAALPPCFQGLM